MVAEPATAVFMAPAPPTPIELMSLAETAPTSIVSTSKLLIFSPTEETSISIVLNPKPTPTPAILPPPAMMPRLPMVALLSDLIVSVPRAPLCCVRLTLRTCAVTVRSILFLADAVVMPTPPGAADTPSVMVITLSLA